MPLTFFSFDPIPTKAKKPGPLLLVYFMVLWVSDTNPFSLRYRYWHKKRMLFLFEQKKTKKCSPECGGSDQFTFLLLFPLRPTKQSFFYISNKHRYRIVSVAYYGIPTGRLANYLTETTNLQLMYNLRTIDNDILLWLEVEKEHWID
jgi:hypothetical protein